MAAGLPILELADRRAARRARSPPRAARGDRLEPASCSTSRSGSGSPRLGVFAGGLDAAAAAAVLDADAGRPRPARRQSLLRRGRSAGRCSRRCASARSSCSTTRERRVRARHAAHYLELAERSEPGSRAPTRRPGASGWSASTTTCAPRSRDAEPLRGRCGSRPRSASSGTRTATAPRARATSSARWPRPATRRRCCAGGPCRRSGSCAPSAATSGPRRRSGRGWRCSAPRATRRASPVALNSLGVMARDRGDSAGARAAFEEAIALLPRARRPPPARRRALQPRRSWRSTRTGSTRPRRSSRRASPSTARSTTTGASRRTSADRRARARPRRARRGGRAARRGGRRRCARSAIGCRWCRRSSGWPPRAAARNDHAARGPAVGRGDGAARRRRRAAHGRRGRGDRPAPRRLRAALGPERFAAAAAAGAALELDAALAEALTLLT